MKLSPYEKRVKRRIVGREHLFFAVCAPGIKHICKHEMLALDFPEEDLAVEQGGIGFKARLNTCMAFNLKLRSPSRILMRIRQFKAESFKTLEKKIDAIDWILFLPENCSLSFSVTTQKSRLYHSDAIAQRCEKIILGQLSAGQSHTRSKRASIHQTVYVRATHDQFTISLDSTGPLLFRRGIKQNVYKAPLRENLAFAMLYWCGFSRDDILIDPMCGSGTFSLEAAMLKTGIPPGFFRSFAFESWPGFREKTYDYLKQQALENVSVFPGKQIFASDMNESAVAALAENMSNHEFSKIIDVSKKDFFSIELSGDLTGMPAGKKGVILLNPPYGKRLEENKNTRIFFSEIGKKLASDFKGWRLGIVLPSRESKSYLGLKLALKPVFHGGLDIFAGIGKI